MTLLLLLACAQDPAAWTAPIPQPQPSLPALCRAEPALVLPLGEAFLAFTALPDGGYALATETALVRAEAHAPPSGTSIPVPGVPADLTVGANALWVATSRGLVRVPLPWGSGPATLAAATPPLGRVVVSAGRVWASDVEGTLHAWPLADPLPAGERVTLGRSRAPLAPAQDGVVASTYNGFHRVRAAGGLVVGEPALPGFRGMAYGVASRDGQVWGTGFGGALWRRSGGVAESTPAQSAMQLASTSDGVLLAARGGVWRWVDADAEATRVPGEGGVIGVASDGALLQRHGMATLGAEGVVSAWEVPAPPMAIESLGEGWAVVWSDRVEHLDGAARASVPLAGPPTAVASDGLRVVLGTGDGAYVWAGADTPLEPLARGGVGAVAVRGDRVALGLSDRTLRGWSWGPDGWAEDWITTPFAGLSGPSAVSLGPDRVLAAADSYPYARLGTGWPPRDDGLITFASGLDNARIIGVPVGFLAALPGWGVQRVGGEDWDAAVPGSPVDLAVAPGGMWLALGLGGIGWLDDDGTSWACGLPGDVRRVHLRSDGLWTATETTLTRWATPPSPL
ncbi:MAG: hypothetical protein ACI8PZ_001327 [Myxococcota bacterium]|jgi:hypothetical protein